MVVEEAPAVVYEVSPVDTDITTHASAEPSIYTDGVFPRGHTDRSALIGYADSVAFSIWQGEVYMYHIFLLQIIHY